jgi:hypothetical protein
LGSYSPVRRKCWTAARRARHRRWLFLMKIRWPGKNTPRRTNAQHRPEHHRSDRNLHPAARGHRGSSRSSTNPGCPCWCLWRSTEARTRKATQAGCGACGTCGGEKSAAEEATSICPVPGCKNVAAPIFGMVCKDHKNVAKSKIKKYREERREGKVTQATGAKPATAKKVKKTTPKVAGAETSRAVLGCLEIAHRRGQGKGEADRSGEGRGRGREAGAVDEEGATRP